MWLLLCRLWPMLDTYIGLYLGNMFSLSQSLDNHIAKSEVLYLRKCTFSYTFDVCIGLYLDYFDDSSRQITLTNQQITVDEKEPLVSLYLVRVDSVHSTPACDSQLIQRCCKVIPMSRRRWFSAGSMAGQRRRRWSPLSQHWTITSVGLRRTGCVRVLSGGKRVIMLAGTLVNGGAD